MKGFIVSNDHNEVFFMSENPLETIGNAAENGYEDNTECTCTLRDSIEGGTSICVDLENNRAYSWEKGDWVELKTISTDKAKKMSW